MRNEEGADALIGVPGLGPARITLLQTAGITTRTALAQASVEQIVSVTGMPRAAAEKARETVLGTASPATTPPPPTDEMMPDASSVSSVGVTPEQPEPEPTDPEPEISFAADLYRATITISTALAEATQRFPELEDSLTKLARRLQKMPDKAQRLPEKRQAKIAKILDRLTAHLEKAIHGSRDLSKAERKRLNERIEAARDALRDALK